MQYKYLPNTGIWIPKKKQIKHLDLDSDLTIGKEVSVSWKENTLPDTNRTQFQEAFITSRPTARKKKP